MSVDVEVVSFISDNALARRQALADKIRIKSPNNFPIIVGRAKGANIPKITKHKFIVSGTIKFQVFLAEMRKYIIGLTPSDSIFCFVGAGVMAPLSSHIDSLYETYCSNDGFLYIIYMTENTFG